MKLSLEGIKSTNRFTSVCRRTVYYFIDASLSLTRTHARTLLLEEGGKNGQEITEWHLASCVLWDCTLLLQSLNLLSKHTNKPRERLHLPTFVLLLQLSLHNRNIPFTPKMDNTVKNSKRKTRTRPLLNLLSAACRDHSDHSLQCCLTEN